MPATMKAAPRERKTQAFSPPPHFRPPRKLACGAGDDEEPEDAQYEQRMKGLEDAETADGCDWPEGSLSPSGCKW